MIPEAKTLIQKIAGTQYSVITEKGRTSPYTFDMLYQVPKEHSADGLGQEFQTYLDELTSQGKELTIWKVASFFKRVMAGHIAWFFLAQGSELPLAFLIHLNLNWLNSDEEDFQEVQGLTIICSILAVTLVRVVGCFRLDHMGELNALRYTNAIGVLFFSGIFGINCF